MIFLYISVYVHLRALEVHPSTLTHYTYALSRPLVECVCACIKMLLVELLKLLNDSPPE
jgi:hypothetical protein